MTTTSEIMQLALTKMGRSAYVGTTATGGSVATFVDTKLGSTYSAEDLLNGSCIVTRDAGGASAPPEGQFGRITLYTPASWTGSITTLVGGDLTAAIASNDTIMIVFPKYPLTEIIRSLNEVLQSFGRIPSHDTAVARYAGARGNYHASVSVYGDLISEFLAKDLVACKLARQLFFYTGINDNNREEYNKVTADLQVSEIINPIWWDRALRNAKKEPK